MYLGKVVGNVVAQVKAEGLAGTRMLLVQPLDDQQEAAGPLEVAIDTVRAGPGDLVFLVGSREAALALDESFVPVDAAVVGIVDSVGVPQKKAAAKDGKAYGGKSESSGGKSGGKQGNGGGAR